jgi:hypothetical protein
MHNELRGFWKKTVMICVPGVPLDELKVMKISFLETETEGHIIRSRGAQPDVQVSNSSSQWPRCLHGSPRQTNI